MHRLLVLLSLLVAGTVQAGVVFPDLPAPADADSAQAVDASPFTLLSQEVTVEIFDQVATTTLTQVFRNDGSYAVGGTFVLPLSEQASVQEYAFWVGGHRVSSSIQEKAEAKKTVERAAARGENAALLEYKDADSFTAKFTELAAGETRRFEVVYSELLPYEDGLVRYSHPLDYASLGLDAPAEILVQVRIEDSKPITRVVSPTFRDDLELSQRSEFRADATLDLRDVAPKTDFELEYRVESEDFGLAFRTFATGEDEGFFVAMIAPKEEASSDDIVKKDIAFVFDVSGSMSGQKIDQARQALKGCLNLMNPGDGTYIVAFNDTLNPWLNGVRSMDEPGRAAASLFADGLTSGGGTNIRDAVVSALGALEESTRPTAIVFLTDGLGQFPAEETLNAIEAANPDRRTRVFAFGVGQDVNQAFLERLGRENRGGYTAINGGVAIDEAVAEFYSSISKPVLTELALDFGDVVPNRTYPSILPDVYKGQRLVLSGRYRGNGPSKLTVTGRIGENQRTLELPIVFPKDDTQHQWVARLWAKRRADHLLAQVRMYGETPEARDEVIALSTEYGFATPYTSLVAHADPKVASLTPARIKPGDPVLAIPAPRDAVSVTAFLPFGEVKDLVFERAAGLWTTRFLVPRSADDGVYWIHVVATMRDGSTDWFKVSYTVDTLAPVVEIALDEPDGRYSAGGVVEMRARPVIGFLELGEEMVRALGKDAAARAKAFVDVKRVVARLGGTRLETVLRSEAGAAPGWHGAIQLPTDLRPGRYELEVTATDVAGNKHTVVRELVVTRDEWMGRM
jgi:Ca-activated chloride channel homolog